MKKIFFITALIFIFCMNLFAASQVQPQASKKGVKKRPRILKYVSPPRELLELKNIPLTSPISGEVISFLAKGKLKDASRTFKSEPASAKSLHLSREIQRILSYNKSVKDSPANKHSISQNTGIAYHNLYLFLKRNNINQKNFYKKGLKFYKRALKTDSASEATETKLLTASLLAAGGETKRAGDLFSEIDLNLLDKDFKTSEYLASYYAATRDMPHTVNALKDAHLSRPEQTLIWLAISDDFYQVEQSPEFDKMKKDFAAESEQKAKLKKKKKTGKKAVTKKN